MSAHRKTLMQMLCSRECDGKFSPLQQYNCANSFYRDQFNSNTSEGDRKADYVWYEWVCEGDAGWLEDCKVYARETGRVSSAALSAILGLV